MHPLLSIHQDLYVAVEEERTTPLYEAEKLVN